MLLRRMSTSLGLAVVGVGGGALWILAWGITGYVGVRLRPLAALAYLVMVSALLMLYLARLPSLRRRRWAATIGIRGFGPGAVWFLAALPAVVLTTLLLGAIHLRVMPGYGGAPQLDYAYQSLPLGALVLPFFGIFFMPVLEETGVRGLAQGTMARRFGPVIAASIAAVPWAFAHGAPPLLLYYFAGGLVYAYARVVTRSIWSAVLLHIADNAVLIGLPAVFAGVRAWSVDTSPVLLLVALLATAAVAVGTLRASGNAVKEARRRRVRRPPAFLAQLTTATELDRSSGGPQ